MLDEIAGQAILKIPLLPGSCALGSDDQFYLNWIGREKMAENYGLHQPDILGPHEKDPFAHRQFFKLIHCARVNWALIEALYSGVDA
jgi:hypothetical protein